VIVCQRLGAQKSVFLQNVGVTTFFSQMACSAPTFVSGTGGTSKTTTETIFAQPFFIFAALFLQKIGFQIFRNV